MDEPVFCICRKPDDGAVMIQCNHCDEWYHISCVGVSPTELDVLKEYRCPSCEQQQSRRTSREARAVKRSKTEPQLGSNTSSMVSKAKFPTYKEDADHVRRTVQEGLETILSPFWEERTEDCRYDDVNELAMAIERALFNTLAEGEPEIHGSGDPTRCGNKYKAKYRTLQFNLKDPKNSLLRGRLFSGDVSPEKLMSMSPQEMANEEVAEMIRTVREQSITQLMIPDGAVEAGFTRKAQNEENHSRTPEYPESIPSNLHSNEMTRPTTTAVDQTWLGKIYLPEVGRFIAEAKFITSASNTQTSQTLLKFLPHNLHVSGRIPVGTASDYIRQIWAGSSSRDVLLFTLSPVESSTLSTVIDYLLEHDRWAVIAHDPGKAIRDFYLAAIAETNVLPEGALPSKDSDGITFPALIGVLVVSKDGKVVSPPMYDPYDPRT